MGQSPGVVHELILLEQLEFGYIWIDKAEFMTNPEPQAGGNTGLELVRADIAAGKDITGYAKYRKILEYHGILSNAELMEWRGKLVVSENDLPGTGTISSG